MSGNGLCLPMAHRSMPASDGELAAGFADEATLPPGVLDIVLRMTAYLYESREWEARARL